MHQCAQLVSEGHTFESVEKHLLKKGLSPPSSLVFADTNWPTFYFSIVYNPAVEDLELWRTNILGTEGFPMRMWNQFMSKEQKELGVHFSIQANIGNLYTAQT